MRERQGFDGTGKAHQGEDTMGKDAVAREEMALRLTLEAMRQSQRAVVGLLALPASVALGVAATVSYAAAFLERGFQTFELSLSRIARDAHLLTGADHSDERPMFPGADARQRAARQDAPARSGRLGRVVARCGSQNLAGHCAVRAAVA